MSLSFTAQTKDLAAVIAGAANALPAHPSQDIYARMLLSTDLDADHVCLLASDGEMRLEIRGNCVPDESADRKGYGKCTVPGRLLNDISKYFSADQVRVEQDGSELKITSGRSRFSLPAGDADDFPAWKMPAPPFIRLDGDELAAAFRKVAASTGEHPAALTAACLDIRDGVLSVVTTDRSRMAVATLPYTEENYYQAPGNVGMATVLAIDRSKIVPQALLPAKIAEKFARNLTGTAGLGWNEGVLFMQYSPEDSLIAGGEMMARLIADPYPDWRRIAAKEPEYTGITVDTKDMIRAVRMTQLAAGSDDKISWIFGDHEIAVTAEREDRECVEYVPASYDGPDTIFLLGARYMLDGLAGCGDTAEVTFTGQLAPLFLRGDNFTYMVLPRREL